MQAMKGLCRYILFSYILMKASAFVHIPGTGKNMEKTYFSTVFDLMENKLESIFALELNKSMLKQWINLGKRSNYIDGFVLNHELFMENKIKTESGLLSFQTPASLKNTVKESSKLPFLLETKKPKSVEEENIQVHNKWVSSMRVKTEENYKIRHAAFLNEGLRLVILDLYYDEMLKDPSVLTQSSDIYKKKDCEKKYKNKLNTVYEKMVPMTTKAFLSTIGGLPLALLKEKAHSMIDNILCGIPVAGDTEFKHRKDMFEALSIDLKANHANFLENTVITESLIDAALGHVNSILRRDILSDTDKIITMRVSDDLIKLLGLYKIANLGETDTLSSIHIQKAIQSLCLKSNQLMVTNNYYKMSCDMDKDLFNGLAVIKQKPVNRPTTHEDVSERIDSSIELTTKCGTTISFPKLVNGRIIHHVSTPDFMRYHTHAIGLEKALCLLFAEPIKTAWDVEFNDFMFSAIVAPVLEQNTFHLKYNKSTVTITPIPTSMLIEKENHTQQEPNEFNINMVYKNILSPGNEYTLYKHSVVKQRSEESFLIKSQTEKINYNASYTGSNERDLLNELLRGKEKLLELCFTGIEECKRGKDKTISGMSVEMFIDRIFKIVFNPNSRKYDCSESEYTCHKLNIAFRMLIGIKNAFREICNDDITLADIEQAYFYIMKTWMTTRNCDIILNHLKHALSYDDYSSIQNYSKMNSMISESCNQKNTNYLFSQYNQLVNTLNSKIHGFRITSDSQYNDNITFIDLSKLFQNVNNESHRASPSSRSGNSYNTHVSDEPLNGSSHLSTPSFAVSVDGYLKPLIPLLKGIIDVAVVE
ncbi:hypothetical protein NEAUS03_0066 [Nematocida ausubeli]|nr:hypothetical protein NEAUS03_0066 [Nematocida ausubeli]